MIENAIIQYNRVFIETENWDKDSSDVCRELADLHVSSALHEKQNGIR